MEHHGHDIRALVEQGWGVVAPVVRRTAGGLDPNAATFDLTADDGTRYFVKLRAVPADVTVPRYLRRNGVTAVVAPLDTRDGRPFLTVDGTQVLLYPFVDGRDCWAAGFTDDQYVAYGRILAAVHAAGAPPGVPRETFDPPSIPLLRSLAGRVAADGDLADLWRAHDRLLRSLSDRAEELRAATDGTDLVLCHGDIHTGNVLARPTGELSVVDWDAPVLAPRERDLVFPLAGPWGEQKVTERREALFFQGYGRCEVHRPTLDYYHVERIVDDIGQFALSVLDPGADGETKRTALYWLRRNLGEAAAHPV
jgi:spectinomycin phosphotransferase